MKKKLLIIAAANNFNFINDIALALNSEFNVTFFRESGPVEIRKLTLQNLINSIKNNDIIWLEWYDGICLNIIDWIQRNFENITENKKFILRIHRYELFNNNLIRIFKTTTFNKIKVIFVSPYVRAIAKEFNPMQIPINSENVIPNLIDHTKFPFHEREQGYNILFLGRISYVKNLPMLLQFFNQLIQQDNRYKLHIVGDITDKELFYFAENFVRKSKLTNNVYFHGSMSHSNLPEYMKQMHYIVCMSIFESQGVGILEGMCTGLKPIVYNFGGADYFYPDKYLFLTGDDFVRHFFGDNYNPTEYHNFVVDNFSIEKNVYRYVDLINK